MTDKTELERITFYHDGPAHDDNGEYVDADEAFAIIDELRARIAALEEELLRCLEEANAD